MARTLIRKKKASALNTTIWIFVMKREVKWIRLPMLCFKVIEVCGNSSSSKIISITINCALYASLTKLVMVCVRKEIKRTRIHLHSRRCASTAFASRVPSSVSSIMFILAKETCQIRFPVLNTSALVLLKGANWNTSWSSKKNWKLWKHIKTY